MEFKTQSNNSQQPQQAPAPASGPSVRPAANNNKPSGSRKAIGLVIALVVALALLVGGLMLWQAKDNKSAGLSAVEEGKYQALFLTNGQVYFGNLQSAGEEYVELTDVYYLQVQQDVQPAAEKPKTPTDQPQVSLTKLGNELHGPTDKMHVSKDQVLFWENLKDDSTVVKAIKDYKTKQ